jgi:transcriptional regulator of acetoin/glycerol metabolism
MDLIDRMILRLHHIEPHIDAASLRRLEVALRLECGGEVGRVRKRTKKDAVEEAVREHYTGDVARLAAEIGCHRSTVYRVLSSRMQKVAKT